MTSEGWVDRYFEDFKVGEVYRHAVGRTISDADNTWFTLLTVNTQQLHFNAEAAVHSEFGRILVNSCLTLSVVTGLTVADITQHVVANLGWDDVRLPHPVFVGDTLWAESVVLGSRPSRSRPAAGIVEVGTRGLNQDGEVCVAFRRTAMVHCRGAEEGGVPFPRAATPITEVFAR